MARYTRRASGEWTGRRWAIIGIAVFIAFDIVLVGWALVSVRTPPNDPAANATVRSPAPEPSPSGTATTLRTPTPTSTGTPAAAVAPKRVLAAVDANTAWRATTGSCPATQASLQLTTDGGKTWKTSDASGPTGASSPVRILAASGTDASVVALKSDGCVPQFIRTYVGGDNWADYDSELNGTWFVNPRTASTVHSPAGDVKAPCSAVVGLAARDSSHAAVLCADHRVFRTGNGGSAWGSAATVPGAVAITDSGSGYVAAATGEPRCGGVLTSTLDATAGDATSGGCLKASAAPGEVAISSGGASLWLWAGNTLGHSMDGGKTWH